MKTSRKIIKGEDKRSLSVFVLTNIDHNGFEHKFEFWSCHGGSVYFRVGYSGESFHFSKQDFNAFKNFVEKYRNK